MQYLFVILLMFTGAATGSLVQDPVVCRFTESNQCYVAVGRRLHLQMPLKDEDGFDLKITDKTSRFILKHRKTQSNPPKPNLPRWQFVIDNKTMILTSAERSDSGTYTLEMYDVNGNNKGTSNLQLNTEAEVSSVKVWSSCLSPGVRKVFCSADGENLRFNWTSDPNTLPQVENGTSTLILEDGNSTLILDKNHHGKVTCRVENHVSSDHDTTELQPCPEPTTMSSTMLTTSPPSPSLGTNSTVSYKETNSTTKITTSASSSNNNSWVLHITLMALGSVCVILIIVSIFVFYMYKKKESQKSKNASSQDGGELVYAQVTHIPMNQTETRPVPAQDEEVEYATVVSRANKKKKKKEDEVQYGELVFNTPAKNQRETPKVQDDCVYSQVHHGR